MITVVGLDGEMSSATHTTGALIQAGIAVQDPDGQIHTFCRLLKEHDIDYQNWWEEQAEQVHHIKKEEVLSATRATIIDDLAYQWLKENTTGEPLYAVGYNVMSFDIPFFKKALPKTTSLFSHRGIDLNSILLTLDGYGDKPWTYYKDLLKDYCKAELENQNFGYNAHNAGWDAAEAIIAYSWLTERIRVW